MTERDSEILCAFSRITSAADLIDCVLDAHCDNKVLRDRMMAVGEAIRCFAEQGAAITENLKSS